MAFNARFLEAVHHEIHPRKVEVGRLSLVEFDDIEYQILLERAQEIVRCYEQWRDDKRKKARLVFLSFIFEYLRHTNYIEDDNKFWEEFEDIIGIGRNEHRNLIYKELLESAFKEEGIKLERKAKRLFVKSLLAEVRAAKSIRQEFVAFFCWYYQYHRSSKIAINASVTSELIQNYRVKRSNPLSIHLKAIPTLDRDCQTLADIIDYATEHSLFLVHTDFAAYQEELIKVSNGRYDLNRIRLIRNRETICTLIIKLENHRTPTQFLQELEHCRRAAVILLPVGKGISSPANEALRSWKASDLIYGSYMVDFTNYRVVPFSWLRLAMIELWPYEEVIRLQRDDHLAYKKSKPFNVKIGDSFVKARRCIFENGKECYIWADTVPRGEPLFIDNRLCRETAGLDWETSLELSHNEDGEPDIMLVFDWLKAFYPEKHGQCLIIRTSLGHEKTTYLDHEHGVSNLHRAISFHLDRFDAPLSISISLGEQQLQRKTIEPAKAYLFSALTQKRIPSGTKREWGEEQYVLFADHNKVLEAGEGVSPSLRETYFGKYAVYDIKWDKRRFPFHLRLGDLAWDFEKQRYFYIQLNQLQSQGPIHLSRQQIQRFTQEKIQLWTNRELTVNRSITCYLSYQGNDEAVTVGFQKRGDDVYFFDEPTLKRLNSFTVDQHRYRQFDLRFYEIENGQVDRRLLSQTSLTLIPEVQISLPSLFIEGRVSPVSIHSPHLRIWEQKTNRLVNSADFLLSPKLSRQPWKNAERVPEGIHCLTAQTVRIPVTFSSINETVEVEVCPSVFGFRLYQRQKQQPSYQQVNQLDYYNSKMSALYVHTVPYGSVAIHVNQTNVRVEHADEDGHLLIKNLQFLKNFCKEERTAITVVSEGLKGTFFVCWTPFIHDLNVKENSIEFSGPQNTGITLRLVDTENTIRYQHLIACDARHFKASLDLPAIEAGWGQCYLMPYYRLADGTLLPTVWQQRLETSNVNRIPMDWLQSGIGMSSEMLLQHCIV